MNPPTRIALFAVTVGLAAGGAALAGAAIDPTDGAVTAAPHSAADAPAAQGSPHGGGHTSDRSTTAATESAQAPAPGLAISQDGYTLKVDRTTLDPGRPARLTFQILGPDGRPLRDEYERSHERELHLIVVRRDTTGFQHLHPTKDGSGTWGTPLRLAEPGVYRMYADFTVEGQKRTLAADLNAPGAFLPAKPVALTRSDRVAGLDVRLDSTRARAGTESELTFTVSRNGRPATDLQPYLGARGHLVALRAGDLAYLHVHPLEETATQTDQIRFAATFPTAGRYRLFLQFKTDGAVRTVDYTVEVPR
ncbi:hypothetical protein GKE82_25405 [Conexibacter sp. W3-3-2]|uniref:hypothetical protein n=1 Tax=Conexibacter sp. W3-3-2 TaxID=2675227 RepID=UPI0012B95B2C|nr:hypothetical protein [Conexibacter sp. W3-3-2]MTD47545.1 hypothetical protein [Conexibacter sp. W3-3-2]